VRDTQHGQCLTDETITEYLEGNLEPPVKAASEVHLVSCEKCRELLAFFMRVLQPEISSEEAVALEAISVEWDKRKASAAPPQRKSVFQRWVVPFAAVAAAVLVAVSVWLVREQSVEPKSAIEVVRLLLEQNRPFEARMTGQTHRPIVRTRGAKDSGVSYGLLAGEMSRLAANSYEMGRFHLLQKDFVQAIPYLETAEREAGAIASVHNDLGVAYLESGNRVQFEMAEAQFLRALQQDGALAAAAFNLALFYERTNDTAKAEAQWKRYLELDSKSDWATEAKGRLQGLSR